jgi:hypothetical protein
MPLLPVLYLRGIPTGDLQEALAALLGKDAPNVSPAVLARLKAGWQEEYERWKKRIGQFRLEADFCGASAHDRLKDDELG